MINYPCRWMVTDNWSLLRAMFTCRQMSFSRVGLYSRIRHLATNTTVLAISLLIRFARVCLFAGCWLKVNYSSQITGLTKQTNGQSLAAGQLVTVVDAFLRFLASFPSQDLSEWVISKWALSSRIALWYSYCSFNYTVDINRDASCVYHPLLTMYRPFLLEFIK